MKKRPLGTRTIALILALIFILGAAATAAVALWMQREEDTPDASSAESAGDVSSGVTSEQPEPSELQPAEIHGVWIETGADGDLPFTDDATADSVAAALSALLADAKEMGFNTLFVETPLYSEQLPLLETVCETAHAQGFYIQAWVDPWYIGAAVDDLPQTHPAAAHPEWVVVTQTGAYFDPGVPEAAQALLTAIASLAQDYAVDGVCLAGFYPGKDFADDATFAQYGAGASLDDFRRANLSGFVKSLSQQLRALPRDVVLGASPCAVWANASAQESGSATAAEMQAYSDQYVDAPQWVREDWIDYLCPQLFTSTQSENVPFETVCSWWSSLVANTRVALLIGHDATRLGSKEAGFASPEELVKQAQLAKQQVNYRGSVLWGFRPLREDQSGAANALRLFFEGKDVDTSATKLEISEPTETTYKTTNQIFTVRGTSNPLYEVLVNGEPVERLDSGYFAYSCDLKVGKNTIVVSHAGQEVTFTVTRTVDVIRSVSPSKNLSADGGVMLTLSAVAMQGATVTATIDGTRVTLKEEEITSDGENDNAVDDGYANFTGSYTLPLGTMKEQKLGKVVFKGTAEGYTETVNGGSVTVKALPEDTGSLDYSLMATVCVTRDAENYNKGETYNPKYLDDKSAPTQYFLPKGAVDYIVGTAESQPGLTDSDGNPKHVEYYILSSGVMIYQSHVTVTKVENPTPNKVYSAKMTDGGQYSYLTLDMDMPVAVIPSLQPLTFSGGHATNGYQVKEFKSDRIELLFSNTTQTCEIEGLTDNPLFSSYGWTKVSDTQQKLTLKFRKTGAFYGIGMEVNADNQLVIRFKKPVKIEKADNEYGYSLKGVTITLDPGHNGRYPYQPGSGGPDGGYCEAELNLIMADLIKEELESLGAEVYMTRTNNQSDMDRYERVDKIRHSGGDLSIAIHYNGATNKKLYGTSAYYYYPFAKRLSECLHDALLEVYGESIYPPGDDRHDGFDNGLRHYPYYMTRIQELPCVLVETGYITNTEEYKHMADPEIQKELARGYVKGIVQYLAEQYQGL